MSKAAFKPIAFPTPSVDAEHRPDGSIVLRGPALKQDYPTSLGAVLERQARTFPDRVFLAERRPDGAWRRITYRDALASVRALAADGHAVLVASHDVEFIAQAADDAVVLADGEVVSRGPARRVVAESPAFAPQVTKVLGPPWLRVDEVVAALETA